MIRRRPMHGWQQRRRRLHRMCRDVRRHSARDVRSARSSPPSSSQSENSASHHISCDIGCHLFSTLPPFDIGNTVMGYGLGGAGTSALGSAGGKRAIAILGDGGFWHNGLVSSVGNAVFNKNDGVQIIVDNGYSAATGGQDNMSSEASNRWRATRNSIERAVQGVGVRWTRTIRNTYDVARMRDTLKEALLTATAGPKVIVARSECMLNKQRRERPLLQAANESGPAHGAGKIRRRSRHLYGRSFLHPSFWLPFADGGAKSGPVAAGTGNESHSVLRGLRTCVARLRMRRCCVHPSTAPQSSAIRRNGNARAPIFEGP